MSKQTALDWYIEQEQILGNKLVDDTLDLDQFNNEVAKLKTQAKQIEKEQIETAYQAGDGDAYNLEETKNWAEQYYNETYRDKI